MIYNPLINFLPKKINVTRIIIVSINILNSFLKFFKVCSSSGKKNLNKKKWKQSEALNQQTTSLEFLAVFLAVGWLNDSF